MRYRPIPRARPRARRRGKWVALVVALALAAGAIWSWRDLAALRVGGVVPARTASASGAPDPAPEPLATAVADPRQAGLSPLPEILRQAGAATDALDRVRQRHALSRFFADDPDIERARAETTLMAPARPGEAIAGMGAILSERQQVDGRAFIRYDPRTLESRIEGDTLDIFLPGLGLTSQAVIDRVESVDGLLRWSGHFLDFQGDGHFSVTHALGDRYAVGTFDTPLGSYAMESRNGWGWLAPPTSDFVLPADHDDGLPAPASPGVP